MISMENNCNSDRNVNIDNSANIEIAKNLLFKGRTYAAKYIRDECLHHSPLQPTGNPTHQVLPYLLDIILNPDNSLKDWKMIDWLKWLMAAGKTPDEFFNIVQGYDTATTCGLVWTANFVAYRCRTCGISPCMSLCAQCFLEGDHEGHDFNMFKSHAGGACDCGNAAVMKETGFCDRHGTQAQLNQLEVPPDLLVITEAILPRVFLRFLLHCRDHSKSSIRQVQAAMDEAESLLEYLQELSCLGAAMRATMTKVLCNPILYQNLMNPEFCHPHYQRLKMSDIMYREALESIPFGDVPGGYEDIPTLVGSLVHRTILDEIVFWTVKFEFPQKLVCLLIKMRPDSDYEDAFAKAFVQHYSRISVMLVRSVDSDTLSNRVVHVSVQLFSDTSLAYKMTDSFHLLYVMVLSLKNMMQAICEPSNLHDERRNKHKVVKCSHQVMKKHCYWPLLSDLNNILSHKPIAEKFMNDPRLVLEWFSFLSLFQGMNTNVRELAQHIELEPQTYYAAFSAESEASSSPMWAMVSHLKDFETKNYTLVVLKHCLRSLADWFRDIGLTKLDLMTEPNQVSFHLPLHRNYAVFLCQVVKYQGAHLEDVLPPAELLNLIVVHPLRVQIAFYEILGGLWVRNGLQIRGQVMTYIQFHFCNSMVDADLFLLQISAGELPPNDFLMSILQRFLVIDALSCSEQKTPLDEQKIMMMMMLESCLTFLATLATVRTNIGTCERDLAKLETITLLCMKNKTHSELMDCIPIKRTSGEQNKDFEEILNEVSFYRAPNFEASGTMRQGMYGPQNHVWEHLYDPIYVLLRAVDRSYYQNSFDRYKQFCKQSGKVTSKSGNIWPPYRLPGAVHDSFKDPRRLLACRTFHAVILVLLYRALHEATFNDDMLSLTIYLLELIVEYQINRKSDGGEVLSAQSIPVDDHEDRPVDRQFNKWFRTDDIFKNATIIHERIYTSVSSPVSSSSEGSDVEMEELEGSRPRLALTTFRARPLPSGSELVPYEENVGTVVASGESPVESPDTPTTECLALPSGSTPPHSTASSSSTEIVPVDHRVVRTRTYAGTDMTRFLCQARTVIESRLRPSFGSQRSRRPAGTAKALPPTGLAESAGLLFSSLPPLDTGEEFVSFGESIISLLLKLHSKLSGKPGSYRPNLDPTGPDSRIGDGPFFIAKVLDKLCQGNDHAKQCVLETRAQLYPKVEEEGSTSSEEESVARAKEERKRKARERQKKIMAEFNQRQRHFMKNWDHSETTSEGKGDSAMDVEEEKFEKFKAYDCVICNQSIPSTPERPVGLVVLLQATSVLGHQTTSSEPLRMPTSGQERVKLRNVRYPLGKYMEEKADTLTHHFDLVCWLSSMNIGWEGGVHVQTCGHHLHLDCHESYLQSLRPQLEQVHLGLLNIDKGEYNCPLCRQLANSVLPLSPEIGDLSAVVKRSSNQEDVIDSIDRLLKEMSVPSFSQTLTKAMARMMENMTVATYPKYRTSNPSTWCVFMFVSSIMRTNLEVELVQRKGSLVTQRLEAKGEVKRSCIMPLLHVLGFHYKIGQGGIDPISIEVTAGTNWIRKIWSSISQRPAKGLENAIICQERDIPMLFKDPLTVLLQMVLILPSRIDREYLECIICNIYRLVVVRAAVMALKSLSDCHREQATTNGPLASLLALAYSNLRDSSFFCYEQPLPSERSPTNEQWSINDVTCEVRDICLHFLRVAALLKAHLAEEPLPVIVDPLAECGSLEQYLGLWDSCSVVNTAAMGKMCGSLDTWKGKEMNGGSCSSSADASTSLPSTSSAVVSDITSPVLTQLGTLCGVANIWCSDVVLFAYQAQIAASSLLTHYRFSQPRLLRLPSTYDAIFQYYHRMPCLQCVSIPKDPVICLLCGTLVCMREKCCEKDNVWEAVQHSIDCGAGTGIFLLVSQSTVIVIRGPRVCLWGCVHLDCYGEEDRDLKRGKPLYLREDRYNLLEQQWISHSFDHTSRRWSWHQNRF